MGLISYKDFQKLEIKIGKIITAEKINGADKLLKLMVDLGGEKRQLVAGIAETVSTDEIIGKEIPVLTNLESKIFREVESQGMILAADDNGKPVLLEPAEEVPPGSIVK